MLHGTSRLILAPALLIAGLGAAACGASPTAPSSPAPMAGGLAAGTYTLMVYGTATCLADGPSPVPSSVAVPVILSTGSRGGTWSLTAPGQSLMGEVGLENGRVQGFVRGTALMSAVRFSTGELPDSTVAFQGGPAGASFEGTVLAGTPRYEGVGAASGAATTCMSNGFTLKRA